MHVPQGTATGGGTMTYIWHGGAIHEFDDSRVAPVVFSPTIGQAGILRKIHEN